MTPSVPDPGGGAGGGQRERLARAQRALVAALVTGGPAPAGFDPDRVAAAGLALRRKRAGEVAKAWPLLAAAFGGQFADRFATWADRRVGQGALADGFGFARAMRADGTLPGLARGELAAREAEWTYDGVTPPRRRRAAGLLRRARTAWASGSVSLVRGRGPR